MSEYGWKIIEGSKEIGLDEDEGTFGPADISSEFVEALNANEGTPFMMYDDDDEWYYTGRIIGEFDGLEPLGDFGMPNAGCTYIKLWDGSAWVEI